MTPFFAILSPPVSSNSSSTQNFIWEVVLIIGNHKHLLRVCVWARTCLQPHWQYTEATKYTCRFFIYLFIFWWGWVANWSHSRGFTNIHQHVGRAASSVWQCTASCFQRYTEVDETSNQQQLLSTRHCFLNKLSTSLDIHIFMETTSNNYRMIHIKRGLRTCVCVSVSEGRTWEGSGKRKREREKETMRKKEYDEGCLFVLSSYVSFFQTTSKTRR